MSDAFTRQATIDNYKDVQARLTSIAADVAKIKNALNIDVPASPASSSTTLPVGGTK